MHYDIVVVGGGIVGLSTAYQTLLKRPSLKIAILEKEDEVSKHQTGNNSGVIHSGLYYKPGSLKARNCIGGYNMLVDFAQKEEIDFDLCGKVVVATEEKELPYLEMLFDRGKKNGLNEISMISGDEIREVEPHCAGIKGIKVPYTGIINYKQVSEKIAEKIEELGGVLLFGHKVKKVEHHSKTVHVHSQKEEFSCNVMVNCAGLYSDKVTQMSTSADIKIIPFRGEYYELEKQSEHLVKHLIYPVPDPNFPFLGVHFTRMIGGGIEAGPNAVLAYAREGYTKSDINFKELFESLTYPGFIKVAAKYWQTGMGEFYRSYSKKAFTKALQKLIPEIKESDLKPGGAGVRAQACEPDGGLLDDFKIIEENNIVNVVNAPSPAATSSLSIGATLSEKILPRLD